MITMDSLKNMGQVVPPQPEDTGLRDAEPFSTGILGHDEILHLMDIGVIEGADPANVNPASLNVRLASDFLVEQRNPNGANGLFYEPCDFSMRKDPKFTPQFLRVEGSVVLEPGAFCLASLVEKLNLPNYLCCDVMLRSSAARMGIQHLLAGWGDAGYSGHLTLELKNELRYHMLKLRGGDSIVQLRFHRIKPLASEHTYAAKSGKYSGDVGPQGAR